MQPETKQESMTLPPGLPELPPVPDGFDRWEYGGKTFRNITLGPVYEAYEDGEEWFPMNGWPGQEYGSAHYIEAVKSAPIPAAPPVVEEIKDGNGLNFELGCVVKLNDGSTRAARVVEIDHERHSAIVKPRLNGSPEHSLSNLIILHYSNAEGGELATIEDIDPAVRLNIAAQAFNVAEKESDGISVKMAADELGINESDYNASIHWPQLIAIRSLAFADALIAAARKQP